MLTSFATILSIMWLAYFLFCLFIIAKSDNAEMHGWMVAVTMVAIAWLIALTIG